MAAYWWLLCARNKLCLANEVVSSYTLKLIIVNYANLLAKCFLKHNLSHLIRTITWNAYKGSNMILNIDGSSLSNPNVLAFGGLIQNAKGAWIHSFAGNIGHSNIFHTDLMALYHGLCMAWELGIKVLMCYSDSKYAIKLISELVNLWHYYVAILHNFTEFLLIP